MEILMNIKCVPNSSKAALPNRSTLKVVDHHQQLKQHSSMSSQNSNKFQHTHGKTNKSYVAICERISSPCVEYSSTTTSMSCCNSVMNKNSVTNPQWSQQCQSRAATCTATTECPPFCEYAPCCAGMEIPACCASYGNESTMPQLTTSRLSENFSSGDASMPYEYHEPEENFVSIEDDRIKAFLLKFGKEQIIKTKSKVSQVPAKEVSPVFEVIELDDADEREKLHRLKKSAELRAQEKPTIEPCNMIKKQNQSEKRKSPNISLIPTDLEKNVAPIEVASKPEEKIIAHIELLDSDDDSSESECETSKPIKRGKSPSGFQDATYDAEVYEDTNSSKMLHPILTAEAVTCELGCDDDDDDHDNDNDNNDDEQDKIELVPSVNSDLSNADKKELTFHSDDEENLQFVGEPEEGPCLRWDELENSNSRERQLFECHVCGKKVQSNYNLRRHMMIHTGERPFGCDMCDRRFREISDLKKHRRRHAAEKNFVCMICRINPPLENDSTRCSSCDTKNGTLIAAVRPDTVKISSNDIEQIRTVSQRNENKVKSGDQHVMPPLKPHIKIQRTSSTPPINLPPLTPISSRFNLDSNSSQSESNSNSTPTYFSRKEFACPLCRRSFGTRHNLKRHFMIHTGEKPFSCPRCRKPFREYSTLKKHLVTHQRDRWYKCLRCPQKYRDYLNYMEHKNTHGSDVSSDDGGDSTTPKKKSRLRYDDQEDLFISNDEDDGGDDDDISASEDSLECCECAQRFTDIEQYTEHIKVHETTRVLYECYMCKELFEEKQDLVEHMNSKHETKN